MNSTDSKNGLEKICVCWTGFMTKPMSEAMFTSAMRIEEAKSWAMDDLRSRRWGVLDDKERDALKRIEASIQLNEENNAVRAGNMIKSGYVIEFFHGKQSPFRVYVGVEAYANAEIGRLASALREENKQKLSGIQEYLRLVASVRHPGENANKR